MQPEKYKKPSSPRRRAGTGTGAPGDAEPGPAPRRRAPGTGQPRAATSPPASLNRDVERLANNIASLDVQFNFFFFF